MEQKIIKVAVKNCFMSVFCVLLIVYIVIFVHLAQESRAKDLRYEECIESLARAECAKQNKEMVSFSAWQPHVKCKKNEPTQNYSFYILPHYEEGDIYIFNETQIQKCWNYS